MIEFRALGPVAILRSGRDVTPRQAMLRALLAVLISQRGRPISAERLADALWAGNPPATARKTLQIYVHRLRGVLADADRVQHGPGGYALVAARDELDTTRFTAMVELARAAAAAGRAETAGSLFHQALDLWRGEPYEQVPTSPPILDDAHQLIEERLRAQEESAVTDLALGCHADLVGPLAALIAGHPYRESLRALHMIALARSGRQAEALEAYRDTRAVLADQLGIEPGQELQDLHSAILRGDPVGPQAHPSKVAVPAPAQLPASTAAFTGRAAHLRRLDALLPGTVVAGTTVAVVISAISGTAGIGKTTLAVHWAHQVAEHFPDGQLYVNLRGFDPAGAILSTDDALRGFLRALEVPAERIPDELHERSALFRSTLAGRRMLVLLDNARDADHVRPLMPGSTGCLALVTSRNRLNGLITTEGAHPVTLDLLTGAEARQLLDRRLGPARVAAEPQAVEQLITLCAHLPLALAVAAARAATEPQLRLADLVAEVRAARDALDAFAGDDAATDVRAVFSWSYRTLTPGAARMFRLIGLHPGPDIGVGAAASLAGVSTPMARALLAELDRAHLIIQPVTDRHSCHDLLRAYAAELVREADSEADRAAASHRLLDHYLHTGHLGSRRIYPHRHQITLEPPRAGVVLDELADREAAMAWFTVEQASFMAAVRHAAGAGLARHAWQLAWAINTFLDWRGHWHDQAELHGIALASAERDGDGAGQAHARQGLASASIWLHRPDEADRHYRRSVELFGELDDQTNLAHVHLNLSIFRERQGDNVDALEQASMALKIFDAIGHRSGQAKALNFVGWFQSVLGDHQRALVTCQRSLLLHQELEDHYGEAATLDSVGYAQHHLGDHEGATTSYLAALKICADLGDRHLEALVRSHLADTRFAAGDLPSARDSWRDALVVLDELNHASADEVRDKLRGLDESPR